MDNLTRSLSEEIADLDEARLQLVRLFVRQVVACNDPDMVRNFLAWRDDPRLDSLLDLAAELDDERRDQLLFAAEDLYTEIAGRKPKARA